MDLPIDPHSLRPHYRAFLREGRVLLTGHSHQAWPDVAREGMLAAFDAAAEHVDDKWGRVFAVQDELRRQVTMMAKALNVVGLMNTQFAIQGEDIYILEVNPRASRTVPFVAKATGVALAKIAARCMVGP